MRSHGHWLVPIGLAEVIVAPGNAGTATEPESTQCCRLAPKTFPPCWQLAKDEGVGLTVIGPEAPLVAGIVDEFTSRRPALLRPDGSGRPPRRLQGLHQGFPGPLQHPHRRLRELHRYRCRSGPCRDLQHSRPSSKQMAWPPARASSLRTTREEAADAVRLVMGDKAFGDAGNVCVIEDFLEGEEASFMALIDGKNILAARHLAGSQSA